MLPTIMARRKTKSSRKRKRTSNFSSAIRRLKKLNAKQQHEAIGMANNRFIRQLCSQIRKLKHANLPSKGKKTLRKHRKQLRQLMNSRTTMSKRRVILSQKGGGILKSILSFLPVIGPFIKFIPKDF